MAPVCSIDHVTVLTLMIEYRCISDSLAQSASYWQTSQMKQKDIKVYVMFNLRRRRM